MLSRSKAPKTQQICYYKHTRKTSELFLLCNTGIDFSLRNNFPLQKFPILFIILIPWIDQGIIV